MSQKFERSGAVLAWTQAAANIATVIVACLLSVILIQKYFLRGTEPQPVQNAALRSTASIGSNLKARFSNVNWSANQETVILALSTHCHFCTESAPFFRQLGQHSGKPFKIIAVLPQSATEAQDYLSHQGVHVDQVQQMSLDKLGVDGTPTMLLLNKDGVVTKSWVGKLNSEEQSQALKAIGAA